MFNKSVVSLVATLVMLGGPSAVFGAVSGVIVNALKGKSVRVTHVGVEVFKFQPPIAHGNAARSVPLEGCAIGVCAALHHSVPGAVNTGMSFPVGLILPWEFPEPAATTQGVAAAKITRLGYRFRPTVAGASPRGFRLRTGDDRCGSSNHGEFSVPLSGEVYCVWHSALYTGIKYTST